MSAIARRVGERNVLAKAFGVASLLYEVGAHFGEFLGCCAFRDGRRDVLGSGTYFKCAVGERSHFICGENHRVGGEVGALDEAALLIGALTARPSTVAATSTHLGVRDFTATPQARFASARNRCHVESPYWHAPGKLEGLRCRFSSV